MNFSGNIIFLGCENLTEIKTFYNEFLALDIYKDQGRCLIFTLPGGNYLGFCDHLKKKASSKSPIITLLCEDKEGVDEAYNKFQEEDLPIAKAPATNEDFAIYHFFTEDPAGYTVEIQCFL